MEWIGGILLVGLIFVIALISIGIKVVKFLFKNRIGRHMGHPMHRHHYTSSHHRGYGRRYYTS